MLKLWGRTSSINVRKVLLALNELQIPFERIEAGAAFGVVDTPAYRAMNPNGLVPVIEDAHIGVLWESNVIVRYLASRHSAGRLYPDDMAARFNAERWMDWQQTTMNPAGRDAFLQMIRVPEPQRQQKLIDQSVAAMVPLLDMLDVHLATREWMLGDHLTVADIPIACEMHRWWGTPLAHAPHPNLRRWYDAMLARPSSRGVLDLPLS
jgi:glutathione S-transferase